MANFVQEFLSGGYAPHGYCLLWQPELIWTHVISDLLIAGAYFSIPLALISLVRQRKDIEFGWMLGLFALFICACGSTHLMAVWNLWHGDYGLEAVIKAITAAASVPTAIILWPLVKKALAIPSPSQLQLANAGLAAMVSERDGALARLTAEIAQREHAEAALVQAQKIEAVGQLTGGIAHDFNNLLQAIGGNVDLIRRKPDDPGRIARWAEAAAKAVDSGARLTGQLLAFSRTQRLELKRVDPNALVAGMVEMVRRSIGPAIELKTALAPESGVVEADRTQLELAILNLAINARDAMPEGGTLIISTRALTIEPGDDLAPGDYCEIGVSDTGIGMAPDVLQRALEPFYTTKGVGQGTGLGLSMAFGMARQSGGTLRIGSSENEGTTVTILLRRAAGEENGRERVEEGDLPRAPRAGLRVAVVDDDDHVRDVIADTLEGLGYAALPYPDGPTALRALDVAAPDLMILDFAMPGMNGAEVARQVRIACPDLGIIFVSGYSDSAAIDAVMDARMAIMRKPFQASDLARLVEARLAA